MSAVLNRRSARSTKNHTRPRLEALEDRLVPASVTIVNDNWNLIADNGDNVLSVGDTVRNDNDTINIGAVTRVYGVDGFGTVTTGAFTGSVAGKATINDAIANTDNGGTVEVLEGTYAQGVNVSKSLTVRGAQHGVDARTGRPGAAETIIDNADGGFQILADNVRIDGFTIQGAINDPSSPPFTSLGAGIWTNPSFSGTSGGHQILNNIIQNNVCGIELANIGPLQTVVQHNLIRNNNAPGAGSGSAIRVDFGLSNALIDSNRFTGHTDTSVNFQAAGDDIVISNNEAVGNGRFAFLVNLTDSSIVGNTVSGSTSAASADIRIFGGVSNLTIANNALFGGSGDAIRINDGLGGSPNSAISLNENSITGYVGDALEIVAGGYTGTLDASGNWWGSASGPAVASNPGGTGESIVDPSGQVDYSPWLTTDADVSVDPGFQGDFSKLTVNPGSPRHSGQTAFNLQEGVDRVTSGGTVNAMAGTYNEKITVNKSVSLVGAQAGVDARDGRPGAVESVLNGLGGATPLYVTASNVIVNGFTIQGNTSGNQFGFGILLGTGTSGSQVLNNIIQDNVVGLGLANKYAANQTVIQHNLFRNNNHDGPASGNAIYSDEYVAGVALTNVLIDANRFEGHHDAALNLSATVPGSQSAITFSNNDVVGNGRAAFLYNVVNSTFSNNTVSGSTLATSADFRIYGGVQNVSVTGNLLSGGAGDAIRVTGSNNSGLLVHGNSITGYAGDGIEVVSGAYTGPLDATGNWWGATTAAGVAAEISGNVNFTPFLVTGVDTSSAPGFQGDLSVASGKGNVRVKVVGKRLMITGDYLDNHITVEKGPTPNSYRVTALGGTRINGRSGSFVFTNVTRGIDASLMGGHDQLVLDGSVSPFGVPGLIKVRTGRGADLVRLQGVTGKADLGSLLGKDFVQIIDSVFSALAVDMGNGASTSLVLDNVTVTGRTAVRGGNGADTVRAVNSNFAAVLIQTGLGADTVRMEKVHATGRVQVGTGRHADLVAVSDSIFGDTVVLGGGRGNDDLDAGTLGVSNTKGNTFVGNPVIGGFEDFLS